MSPLSLFLWLLFFIIVVFVAVLLVAAYARRRQLDRVLHAFEDYFVTVERRDGRVWSGLLRLTETGFEVSDPADEPGLETSYIHYAVEYGDLQAIYRDVESLKARERSRRLADVERSFRPNTGQRRRQSLLTWLDSLFDTFSIGWAEMIGRANPISSVEVRNQPLGNGASSGLLVGYTGNRYDPLLERSLGQRVMCQLVLDGALYERMGILQSYSKRFLLLLDVPCPQKRSVRLQDQSGPIDANIRLEHAGRQLEITNLGDFPLLLDHLQMGEKDKELGMVIDPKSSFTLNLDAGGDDCILHCQVVRVFDLILPRSHAVVRYRAGAEGDRTLFDVGIILEAGGDPDEAEERLRWELKHHPRNAIAAAGLARSLYRRGALVEAEQHFEQALQYPRALPDGGLRVRQELEQLRRRRRSLPEVRE